MTTEKHVRYSQDVDTLAAAWYFIMNHVDEFTAPSIAIEAWTITSSTYTDGETTTVGGYTASIHGTVDA